VLKPFSLERVNEGRSVTQCPRPCF